MRVTSHILAINAIGLVCAVAVGAVALRASVGVDAQTDRFIESTSVKEAATRDLLAAIGYGGLIHHAKNFILRGEPRYLEAFRVARQDAMAALGRYRAVGEVSEREVRALTQIESMIDEYASRIDDMLLGQPSIGDRDRLARVDDTEFFEAQRVLLAALGDEHLAMVQGVQCSTEEAMRVAIGAVTVATLVLGVVGTMLATRIGRRLSETEQRVGAEIVEREAACESRDRFVANMSHEIRTPMTAILGFAGMLEGDGVRDVARVTEAGQRIRSNADHLLTIINDILDLSKIQAGQLDIERIPTSVVQIVEETASLVTPLARTKGIDLKVRYDTPVPTSVTSDPTRLRQILVNLAGNAVKFTDVGAVTLRVSHDQSSEILRFAVEDTGVGMSPEQLSRFNAFTQADETITRRFGGTGLGLSISNTLAGMLGGELQVVSKQGEGSTFTLVLAIDGSADVPRVQPESGATMVSADEDSPDEHGAATAPQRPLEGHRILLAEDGIDNQRLISFHLRRAGADVTICENGRIAAETIEGAAAEDLPDVIVMDMQMPELDGYSATSRLRAGGVTVPIIALTAHAMDGDRKRCEACGCDDYLTKPVDWARLMRVCAHWAAVAPGRRGTAAA